MSNLLLRIISALLLIPVVVILTLQLPVIFFAWVLAAITLVGLVEWGKMIRLHKGLISLACMFMLVVILFLSNQEEAVLIGLNASIALFWLIQIFVLGNFNSQDKLGLLNFIYGGVLLTAFWSGLFFLYQQTDNGRLIVVALLFLVWSADSFAYCVGKMWGKNKLAPNISPGKTIEGMIGGLVGAVLVSSTFFHFLLQDVNMLFLLVVSTITVMASVVGDLYESGLKRRAGVKDSGNTMPGHGGVLDRIDGLIAASPVFATLWVILL